MCAIGSSMYRENSADKDFRVKVEHFLDAKKADFPTPQHYGAFRTGRTLVQRTTAALSKKNWAAPL